MQHNKKDLRYYLNLKNTTVRVVVIEDSRDWVTNKNKVVHLDDITEICNEIKFKLIDRKILLG